MTDMVVTEEAATICYWKVVNIRDVKDSGCQKALLRAEEFVFCN